MITVVIPTYNEQDNLSRCIDRVASVFLTHKIDGSVIIVDDNSPDGTGRLAERLKQKYSFPISIIHRAQKDGLGRAYLAGFTEALDRGAEYIFEMDADLSHDAGDIPRFLRAAEHADSVLGSRYIRGGRTVHWSTWRRFISHGGNQYARLLLGLPYHDLTSGFKCFHRRTLEQLDFSAIHSDGYAFQVEVTYRLYRLGFHITEIPIVFTERRAGNSKFSKKIFLEALLHVPLMRFRE